MTIKSSVLSIEYASNCICISSIKSFMRRKHIVRSNDNFIVMINCTIWKGNNSHIQGRERECSVYNIQHTQFMPINFILLIFPCVLLIPHKNWICLFLIIFFSGHKLGNTHATYSNIVGISKLQEKSSNLYAKNSYIAKCNLWRSSRELLKLSYWTWNNDEKKANLFKLLSHFFVILDLISIPSSDTTQIGFGKIWFQDSIDLLRNESLLICLECSFVLLDKD